MTYRERVLELEPAAFWPLGALDELGRFPDVAGGHPASRRPVGQGPVQSPDRGVPGNADGSAKFDGIDDYLEVDPHPDFDVRVGDGFTVAALVRARPSWAPASTTVGPQVILERFHTGPPNTPFVMVKLDELGRPFLGVRGDGGGETNANAAMSIDDDRWHLLVAGRDPLTDRLWIDLDGELVREIADGSIGNLPLGGPVYLGANAQAPVDNQLLVAGNLDEVAWFRRSLSIGDRALLAAAALETLPEVSSATERWWAFLPDVFRLADAAQAPPAAREPVNLMGAGSFELDNNADGVADGWLPNHGTQLTVAHSLEVDARARHGARVQRLEITAYTGVDTSTSHHRLERRTYRIRPGRRYTASVAGEVGPAPLELRFRPQWIDVAGNVISDLPLAARTAAQGWGLLTSTGVAPANAVAVRILVGILRPAVADRTLGFARFDGVQVQEGDVATVYEHRALPGEVAPSGWPLRRYMALIGDQAGEVQTLLERFDHDGSPGSTSDLVDPLTADEAWLPWVAQLVGVRYRDLAPPALREAVAGTIAGGFLSGTASAMAAAARTALTGTKFVEIRRHYQGDPWRIAVRTRTTETPSGPAVLDAIAEALQKPAGVELVHVQFETTWDTLEAARPTWNDWEAAGTWTALEETGAP